MLENRDHGVVNQAVAGQAFQLTGCKRDAVKVADPPTGLGDEQHAGGGIPGFKFHLPEAVEAAGSDAGEIEAGSTGAAAGLGLFLKVNEVIEIVGGVGRTGWREAGSEEGAIKTVDRGDL